MSNNPFTLMYGMPAPSIISRAEHEATILKSFTIDNSLRTFYITGIRGCGKTVFLRNVCSTINKIDNWIVLEVNSQGEILESIANKLYSKSIDAKLLDGWSISINLPGVTITKNQQNTISDPEIIIEKLLERLSNKSKNILIAIDEVTNTHEFKKFVNFFQTMIGKGFNFYLLMTGLIENFNLIINDKAMTFLTRAPKIELEPLSQISIALEYQRIFNINKELAVNMAKLTNGYAFAYQVLGYYFYESKAQSLNDDFISQYDTYLWNNGYNKFWNDLTKTEKKFVVALAQSNAGKKEEIISTGGFSKTNFSQYRKRLIEKGLVASIDYDKLEFVLPRFKEFVLYAKDFI